MNRLIPITASSRIPAPCFRIAAVVLAVLAGTLPPIAAQVAGENASRQAPDPAASFDSLATRLHGIAAPRDEVTLRSPIRGVILKILVEEGDNVTAGQPLALLDNRVALAELAVAQAASDRSAIIRRAELEWQMAVAQFEALQQAVDSGAGTDVELEQATFRKEQSRAVYDAELQRSREAEANRKLAEARLAQHTITSPIDGRVIRVHTRAGDDAFNENGILTVGSLDVLQAELYLPLEIYGQLQVGQQYELQASLPVNRPLPATLKLANPFVDPATRSYRCVFLIDNRAQQLPAGFLVYFDLP